MMDWLGWPLLALAAGAIALVPLGREVLRRGVVFMDLAVAQAAAAASLLAMVSGSPTGWIPLAGLLGALACAGAVAAIERRRPQQREALIGLLYVLCSSVALVGASTHPQGREQLLHLLAADVLWAEAQPVLALAAAALGAAGLRALLPQAMRRAMGFYGSFAVVVSLAVPVLGLFVVFALLIGPSLWSPTAEEPAHAAGTFASALPPILKGLLGAWLGLAVSWGADLPSGPCVAATCAAVGLISLLRQPPPICR